MSERRATAPTPTTVLVSQTTHLDWDWVLPHPQLVDNVPPTPLLYFSQNPPHGQFPAVTLMPQAAAYLSSDPGYRYSLSEVAFMRDFAAAAPDRWTAFVAAAREGRFRVVGACFDTPDTVLPHGEAIIRNYLLAGLWVRTALNAESVHAWLPDSFGHDPELPVLLQAMGMEAVSFARVPGDHSYNPGGSPTLVAADLTQRAAGDAVWVAGDGSEALMHWMARWYSEDVTDGGLQTAVSGYGNSAATSFLFIPVGTDFGMPRDIPSVVAAYNGGDPAVRAEVGTFPDYVDRALRPSRGTLPRLTTFNPNPYHAGGYVTFPPLKALLQRATRALLSAEVFSLLASRRRPYPSAALDAAWEPVGLGTSHNILPGGGLRAVYVGEQRPLLERAAAVAEQLRDDAARAVATLVRPPSADSDGLEVLILNALGFTRGGLVEVPAAEVGGMMGSEVGGARIGGTTVPAQAATDGSVLFVVPPELAVRSLGYARAALVADIGEGVAASIDPADGGGAAYVLVNDLIEVTVGRDAGWGITSIRAVGGTGPNVLGATANTLVLYQDDGSGFNFGNEPKSGFTQADRNTDFVAGTATVVEAGPVRVRLRASVSWMEPATQEEYLFVREYSLVAGEPFVRMSLTGSAPFVPGGPGYSAFVEFPLAAGITDIAHGTPSHWRQAAPVRLWDDGPALEPRRDFVIPLAGAAGWQPLGAVYQGAVNGWGATTHGPHPAATLVGGVLRNPPDGNFTSFGTTPSPRGADPDTHTVHYAFRVPGGLAHPSTGAPQREAAAYQEPLRAVAVARDASGVLPDSLSLVTVSAQGGESQPVVDVLKRPSAPGQEGSGVIMRVRTASNAPMDVIVDARGLNIADVVKAMSVRPVTALETDIAGASDAPAGPSFVVHAPRALTTFRIS